jgi:5-formyltetrahydrofolate cyclo-ligase
MIKKCLSNSKNVIVPISDKEKRDLILSKLKSWEDLAVGAYDILEPKNDKIEQISVDEINLAIIPGVGFDKNGNRLGHGFAYYDNLLKKLENCFKIGLAFEFQIVNKIPVEEHDIPVNEIISEDRIIRC